MDKQTAHRIQIVLGGIYRKKIGQTEHLVTMDAVSKTATGKLSGILRVPGFPQETVHEDGTGANGWEFVGQLDDGTGFQADVLEQRIAALEAAVQPRLMIEQHPPIVDHLDAKIEGLLARIAALESKVIDLTVAAQQAPKPKGR